MIAKQVRLVLCFGLGCGGLVLTSCGGGTSRSNDDSGATPATTSSATSGSGGTSATGSGGSGGTSTATSSAGGDAGAVGDGEHTTPREPFDPLPNDEPRTEGDRAEPGERVDCPDLEPTESEDCEADGLDCSYGDSALWKCRRKYTCEERWTRVGEDCEEPPADYCTDEPSPGLVCTLPEPGNIFGPACEYGSMICYCELCEGLQSCNADFIPRWVCVTPPVDLDCPLFPPNIGEGCTEEEEHCVYGHLCARNGVAVVCREGAWELLGDGCPDG